MGKRTNTASWRIDKNMWQINVQKDGQRRSFYSSTPGRNGKRVCNKKADEWLDDGIVNAGKTVTAFLDEWLADIKITTSYSNYKQYNGYASKWIKPVIGRIKMGDLTEGHIQTVINRAFDKGDLAKKTLSNIRGCFSSFLRYSRLYKATTLVMTDISIPKKAKIGEREILQPDDIKILFSNDKTIWRGREVDEWYINAFRFEVTTGLRPGEVAGLQWSDIIGRNAFIQRSINIHNEITSGKNENARRSFTLTPTAVDILSNQLEKLNCYNIVSDWVFPSEDGEHLSQSTYCKRWCKYRDYSGMNAKSSTYELRHTFVSMVKSLPEGLLKQLVGHSKAMDTYGVYSHVSTGDSELAANLVQSAISNIIKGKKNS